MAIKYDIGIIGAGIAGSIAAYRISKKHPNLQVALFDIGRPPGKRRRQLEGFMGSLPAGDGKLYPNDIEELISPSNGNKVLDGRKVRPVADEVISWIESVGKTKLTKTPKISASLLRKLNKQFVVQELDYYSWHPNQIHQFSKEISSSFEESNIIQLFDTIITRITKSKDDFHVFSHNAEFLCKKVIIATGRSGWKYVGELLSELNVAIEDDIARYGIRAEIPSKFMKEFNESHSIITNGCDEIGPLCWNGTVIPEDHADNLVISAFRSNEERWKSEKVSFAITTTIDGGTAEADRISKLAFLLSNDRISKEKIKTFMKDESQLSSLSEFKELKPLIEQLNCYIPDLISQGSFYAPMLIPHPVTTKLNSDLETECSGCYLAGEAADIFGIVSAMITGMIAADAACK